MDRIAAPKRKVKPDTVNRRVEPEQLADELDSENQRGPKTVTANDDLVTRNTKMLEILKHEVAKMMKNQDRIQLIIQKTQSKLRRYYLLEPKFTTPPAPPPRTTNYFRKSKQIEDAPKLRVFPRNSSIARKRKRRRKPVSAPEQKTRPNTKISLQRHMNVK